MIPNMTVDLEKAFMAFRDRVPAKCSVCGADDRLHQVVPVTLIDRPVVARICQHCGLISLHDARALGALVE
jgi:hypothetical protein